VSKLVEAVGAAHSQLIFGRRVRALVGGIDALLPREVKSLADVGCGDGSIGTALVERRPGLEYRGFDVMARPNGRVAVEVFDGLSLPLADRSVDAVMFVDVLHHASDPGALLAEARRVTRGCVIVKDHLADRPGAAATLSLMDWVGNRPHGVTMTWDYWSSSQWDAAWRAAGLRPVRSERSLGLYAPPLRPLFEWGLHHLTLLVPAE
jgi:SAM-dependent methyltransferase